jgi:hypothetical protein
MACHRQLASLIEKVVTSVLLLYSSYMALKNVIEKK